MFDEISPNIWKRSGVAWIPKVQKCVNLVDLVKSFQMTPVLFLSRDRELRNIEDEFS